MTKNEIVARWLDWEVRSHGRMYKPNSVIPSTPDFDDYNLLHQAWVKFRDLKFEKDTWDEFHWIRRGIETSICYAPITEAFDELVKGIEWYNSLTTNGSGHQQFKEQTFKKPA